MAVCVYIEPMRVYRLRARNLRAVAYFLLTKERVTIERSGDRLGVGEPIQASRSDTERLKST